MNETEIAVRLEVLEHETCVLNRRVKELETGRTIKKSRSTGKTFITGRFSGAPSDIA